MLVMSEDLSSVETQLWLLLLHDVLDDGSSNCWDSDVRQPRKKKSPQGVEELMIYKQGAIRGEGEADGGRNREQNNTQR